VGVLVLGVLVRVVRELVVLVLVLGVEQRPYLGKRKER
jgi:hypothetical protein